MHINICSFIHNSQYGGHGAALYYLPWSEIQHLNKLLIQTSNFTSVIQMDQLKVYFTLVAVLMDALIMFTCKTVCSSTTKECPFTYQITYFISVMVYGLKRTQHMLVEVFIVIVLLFHSLTNLVWCFTETLLKLIAEPFSWLI